VRLTADGKKKRYARSHAHKLKLLHTLDPNDRLDRMFLRLNEPGEKECDSCGRVIRDPTSIAIGKGPCCRRAEVKRQQQSIDLDRIAAGDRSSIEEADDEYLARVLVLPWWEPAG
jgi:hypothetical protein